MYITSITHRETLFQLATRWFTDHLEPGDGRFITEALIFEDQISMPTVRQFFRDIQSALCPGPVEIRRIFQKDDLRQAIIDSCKNPGPRARELFSLYRARPEEFFPRTPVHLVFATREDYSLLGMLRIKRIQRIADKASRRIADRLAGTIQTAARVLAEQRARGRGVSLGELASNPLEMAEDFANAERIVSHGFRDLQLRFEPNDMRIDDGIGIKFIGTPEEIALFERAIRHQPRTQVTSREVHSGKYNDINLLIDLELPSPGEIIDLARGRNWSFAAGRGLAPQELERDFPAYVESGARTIRAEVILTTPDELIESEFGRAIHEERILEQRSTMAYSGRIAKNASYIVEYLLMLALSPTVEIDSLPVKMWGRYLPDVFSMAVWKLFGINPRAESV